MQACVILGEISYLQYSEGYVNLAYYVYRFEFYRIL